MRLLCLCETSICAFHFSPTVIGKCLCKQQPLARATTTCTEQQTLAQSCTEQQPLAQSNKHLHRVAQSNSHLHRETATCTEQQTLAQSNKHLHRVAELHRATDTCTEQQPLATASTAFLELIQPESYLTNRISLPTISCSTPE